MIGAIVVVLLLAILFGSQAEYDEYWKMQCPTCGKVGYFKNRKDALRWPQTCNHK